MAKSARASGIKKNKAALKRRVFGPAETARNERLSAKLLEIAKAPKPARQEMEVDSENAKKEAAVENEAATDDTTMDLDGETNTKTPRSKREIARRRAERVEKHSHRRNRNKVTFPSQAKKRKGNKR